jgi:hypothetical protein
MNSRLLLFAAIFIFAFHPTRSALAHGEARLEVSPESLGPGAPLTIHGVGFSYDQELTLTLRRSGVQTPLGTVLADAEGAFELTVIIPVDLPKGAYQVYAVAHELEVISPVVTIQGVPVFAGDEAAQGGISEDDGLLAPMPTFAPGSSSTSVPQTAASEIEVSKPKSTSLIYSVLFGIGLIALAGIRILKKRQ